MLVEARGSSLRIERRRKAGNNYHDRREKRIKIVDVHILTQDALCLGKYRTSTVQIVE